MESDYKEPEIAQKNDYKLIQRINQSEEIDSKY